MAFGSGDGTVTLFTKIDESGLKKGLSSIDSGVGKLGKAIATLGVSAGFIALNKTIINSYANYEQLVGGVDTLFKESSKQVQGYAAQAYKTAGLSANAYMSTVTGFSASLLQSLGGDTQKSAEYANQALIDMSDNANKMGTSMESIQYAYQGFAKQNYTMLDNLKLGYGGTKEEMQRLLEDAEKLTGIKYDISSFADVTQAIHAIQTEMGITGTTAKEASETIQGSAMAMKASWSNLMTGIADPNQDFDKLIQEFVDSVVTFGKNLAPRINIVLKGVVDLFKALGPQLVRAIRELLPQALGAFGTFLSGILGFVSNNIKPIITTIYSLVTAFTVLKAVSAISSTIVAVTSAVTALGVGATGASVGMATLTAVMAVNPFVAIATAIGLVVGGLALLVIASKNSQSETQKAIAQSEANIDKLNEEAQAYSNLKASKEEEATASLAQVSYAQSLYNELTRLADASGYVAEKDRARVEFILGELNSAYGTEISMVGGVIQKYGELGGSIDDIIQKKQAQILLEAQESLYAENIVRIKELIDQQTDAKLRLVEAEGKYSDAQENLNRITEQYKGSEAQHAREIEEATTSVMKYKDEVNALSGEYETAQQSVQEASTQISDYTDASTAIIEGRTQDAIDILSKGNDAFENAANVAGKTTEQIKQQAGQNYFDAVAEISVALDNYNKNQNSSNERALNDAIDHAADMRNEYTKVGGNIVDGEVEGFDGNKYKINDAIDASVAEVGAYKDQYKSKGEDAGQGYADGIASKLSAVKTAIGGLVKSGIEWLAFTQRSGSPSKETMLKGEDFGDGYVIGIASKEKQVKDAVKDMVERAIDTLGDSFEDGFEEGKTEVQKVLDSFNEGMLESDKFYYSEKARIDKEEADAELEERLKNAKTKEEKDKIYAEEEKKRRKQENKEYLNDLKETTDKVKKIYEAQQKDLANIKKKNEQIMKDILGAYSDWATELADETLDAIDDLESKQKTLAEKLANWGDLTYEKTYKVNGKEYKRTGLTDLDKQYEDMQEYYNAIQGVKDLATKVDKKLPSGLFDELITSDPDEAIEIANMLLKMTDADFAEYISDWERNQQYAQNSSKALYVDEMEGIAGQVNGEFDKIENSMFGIGEQSAWNFGYGFYAKMKEVIDNVRGTLSGAFGGLFPSADFDMGSYNVSLPSIATGGVLPANKSFTDMLTSDERSYVDSLKNKLFNDTGFGSFKNIPDQRNTTVILEVDGREFGKAVVDTGSTEDRRIGTKLVVG